MSSPECPVQEAVVGSQAYLQHMASLIFLSYRYSQGGIGTQNRMLQYIEENFHSDIMDGDRIEVVDRTRDLVGRYFLNETQHPATAIPWNDQSPDSFNKHPGLVVNEIAGLFERFRNRAELSTFGSDVSELAQSIIIMDVDYLRRAGGRAGSSKALEIKVGNYARDPFDSLFIANGIKGRKTNTIEYDKIFSEISADECISGQDDFTLRILNELIERYAYNHPTDTPSDRMLKIGRLVRERIHG